MPRDGGGTYSKPAGTTAVASTTIESAKYNQLMDDFVTTLNTALPVSVGGTGVGSVSAAQTAFKIPPFDGTATISGTWTVSGGWTFTANQTFNDSVKALFGTGADLEIYHNGTNSLIADVGSGGLLISGSIVQIRGTSSEVLVSATAGGAVDVRHNGNVKGATTSTGFTVTGLLSGDTIGGTMVATDISANTGSTTKVPNVDAVETAIAATAVGVGQTWQNVAGSRAAGTSYQNTTGKPIMVVIRGNTNSTHYLQVSTDNSTWISVASTLAANANLSAMVPDDHYYRLQSGATFLGWSELR